MNTTAESASSAVRFLKRTLPRCKQGTWHARNRDRALALMREYRERKAAKLLEEATPLTAFSHKQASERTKDKILFGLRSGGVDQWHSITPAQACEIGRALLTAGGKKPECKDWFLDTFRAARIDVRLGGMTPEAAAAKHGIDAELLTAWIARLDAA